MGSANTFIVFTLALGIVIYSWAAVSTVQAMYVFAIFYGVTNTAAQTAFVGALADLTPDVERVGVRSGMIFLSNGFASLAGGPTAGALIDAEGGKFLWAQIWGGSMMILAAVTLTVSKWFATRCKARHNI